MGRGRRKEEEERKKERKPKKVQALILSYIP
jgi:hypothetical protein